MICRISIYVALFSIFLCAKSLAQDKCMTCDIQLFVNGGRDETVKLPDTTCKRFPIKLVPIDRRSITRGLLSNLVVKMYFYNCGSDSVVIDERPFFEDIKKIDLEFSKHYLYYQLSKKDENNAYHVVQYRDPGEFNARELDFTKILPPKQMHNNEWRSFYFQELKNGDYKLKFIYASKTPFSPDNKRSDKHFYIKNGYYFQETEEIAFSVVGDKDED